MHTGCQRMWLARSHHTTMHAKRMCTGHHHMRQRIYRARRQRYFKPCLTQPVQSSVAALFCCSSVSIHLARRQRYFTPCLLALTTALLALLDFTCIYRARSQRHPSASRSPLLTSFNYSFTSFTWRPGRGGSGSARQRMCTGRQAPPVGRAASVFVPYYFYP
jgi:hypothetical protein